MLVGYLASLAANMLTCSDLPSQNFYPASTSKCLIAIFLLLLWLFSTVYLQFTSSENGSTQQYCHCSESTAVLNTTYNFTTYQNSVELVALFKKKQQHNIIIYINYTEKILQHFEYFCCFFSLKVIQHNLADKLLHPTKRPRKLSHLLFLLLL